MILSRLAIKRPVTTAMIFVVIIVVGLLSFSRLKLAWLPTVDFPFVHIWAPYPNASPSYVERMITRPIEEQLAALGGFTRMHTSSEPDGATIRLEYPWGVRMDTTRMRIAERLDRARTDLPEEMLPIRVFTFNSDSIPVVEARISARGIDLSRNFDLIDRHILQKLQRIPGVAKVDVSGVEPREVRIELRMADIYRYRIDVGNLITTLRSLNADIPLGDVAEGKKIFPSRALGRLHSLEEFRNYPIEGGRLKLKDIADVLYAQPRKTYIRRVNGRPAVSVEVYKESTANTVQVASRVKETIAGEINRDPALKGINVFTWNDQAKDILDGLHSLLNAGLWGALLAALVLALFLRHPVPTLMVTLSIPFSILIAGTLLFLMGKSLNMLTMMGLMLAVGMLVDNCIVVLEAIVRRIWKGENGKIAAEKGSAEVGIAVTAATLTTVIVFLPLLLGGKGEIFMWLKDVGVTVTLAIVSSLFVALTLIPFLFGRLGHLKWKIREDYLVPIRRRYERLLAASLRHRWRMGGIALIAFILSILPLLTGWVRMSSFKGGIKNTRMGFRYVLNDHFTLKELTKIVDAMEAFLTEHKEAWGIDTIYSPVGEERAATIMTFRENLPEERAKEVRNAIRHDHPPFPGVDIRFWHQDEEEGGKHVKLYVYADSMETVEDFLPVALKRLEKIKNLEDVHSDLQTPAQEVVASLDEAKASRVGYVPSSLARLFAFTLGSQRLHRYQTSNGEVEVRFSLREKEREDIGNLKNLLVASHLGKPLQLGEIASFTTRSRPTSIERENRKVGIGIDATYEGKDFGMARKEIRRVMESLMQPGMSWGFSRRIMREAQQGKQMLLQFLLALILIYCVMASLFESLAHPFAIVLAMPYALFGVTWFFLATHSPLNIMAQIGLLILMGIVVNNGIVFLDWVKRLRAQGLSRTEALIQGGGDRLRPILMTAATTIVGLLPLALGKAAVSHAYYYPLARTVVGGLTTSTFLTLLILPYIYTLVDDAGGFLRRLAGRLPFVSSPDKEVV